LDKGVILRSVAGKTTTYVAANPEKLEKLLEDIRDGFSAILPGLQEKFLQKKSKDIIKIYE
jgi:sugar-specific transcriptional regulator TrmB